MNEKIDNLDTGNNTLDVRNISNMVIDYKNKLNSLKEKDKLDDKDRLLIKQIREFIETIKNKEGAKELYKKQSKELLDLLSQISEEKNQIITESKDKQDDLAQEIVDTVEKKVEIFNDENQAIINFLGEKEYFKDINLSSAIFIISNVSGTDYSDYSKAGYKADGFFGPFELSNLNLFKKDYESNTDLKEKVDILSNLKSKGYDLLRIINSIKIIEKNGVNKVFESLCDLNNDGILDNSDEGLINGKDIFDLINKNQEKETEIIKNISEIVGIQFNDKKSLFNALKSNPTLKYDFFSKLYFFANAGSNIVNILLKGKEGISKSVENMGKNLLLGDRLAESLIPGFEKKYDESIKELEKKLENSNLSTEEKNKLIELISIYKGSENKKSFIESFKTNFSGLFLNLIKGNKGIGAGISLTNSKINEFLKENTNKLIDSMQINLGFMYGVKGFMPGIGINFSSREFNISENTKLNFNGGLFLTIPYLAGTVNYNYNSKNIKDAGFIDFSEDAKKIGITLNASTIANGITLHWNKDKLEAIDKKEKDFKELLNELFIGDFDKNQIINFLNNNNKLSKNDKKYIEQFIEKIDNVLNLIGYNKLDKKHKELAISGIKYALLNEWKVGLFTQAQKDGFKFSGVGVGLQFIAGFLPIITAGIKFTNYKTTYIKDRQGENIQRMSSSSLQETPKTIVTEPTKLEGKEIVKGLEEFKNAELDEYLTNNQDKIVGLAQRHIRDYPEFLKNLTSGNYENALIYLQRILKTDPIIKNDIYIKNLLKSINSFDDIKKAYILSQFMDSIFQDKNSISQVFSNNRLWNDREKGLKGVYNNDDIYSEVIELRNKIKNKIGTDQNPILEESIIGFVASYKIRWTKDGEKKSLGKGEAAIPPGLATVIGGQNGIEKVTNDKLINHIISNLEKTIFYGKLESSFEKIISTKYVDFKFNDNEFKNFLKTGELKIGDKTIKLNRDFVFFLYGKCVNESFGLKINGIDLGDGKIQVLELDPTGEIQIISTNMPILGQYDYTIGIVGGDGKKENIQTTTSTDKPITEPGHTDNPPPPPSTPQEPPQPPLPPSPPPQPPQPPLPPSPPTLQPPSQQPSTPTTIPGYTDNPPLSTGGGNSNGFNNF